MKVLIFQWPNRYGAFVIIGRVGDGSGAVTGHFLHTKEQARAVLHDVMDLSPFPLLAMFDDPRFERSLFPSVELEEEHTAMVKTMVEQILALPSNCYIGLPQLWWVCFWKVPLQPPDRAGAVGYIDDKNVAHICFFFSKTEAFRLLEMQKNCTPAAIEDTKRVLRVCQLPHTAPQATVELTGPMAHLLCGGQSVLNRQRGVRLIPKDSKGNA